MSVWDCPELEMVMGICRKGGLSKSKESTPLFIICSCSHVKEFTVIL